MRLVMSFPVNDSDTGLEAIEHVVHDGLPIGMLLQVFADPNVGTTDRLCRLTAHISRGWMRRLDGAFAAPRTVVFLSAAPTLDLRDRLIAAGADVRHVIALWGAVTDGATERESVWFFDEPARLQALVRHVEAALVVVDPLEAFIAPGLDETREDAIDGALAVLETIADSTETTVIAVRRHAEDGGVSRLTA